VELVQLHCQGDNEGEKIVRELEK